MEYVVVLVIVGAVVCFVRGGFSFSSMGGVSVSSTNNHLNIKGQIVSVSYQNRVLLGDVSKPAKGSNSISQSNNGISLLIKGGHATISGKLEGLKVNGKNISL